MSKKLNFGVSDLVRHRAYSHGRLGIIIEIDCVTYAAGVAHVLWGGERLTWNFFSSLVRCNLPRTVV